MIGAYLTLARLEALGVKMLLHDTGWMMWWGDDSREPPASLQMDALVHRDEIEELLRLRYRDTPALLALDVRGTRRCA
jgi:hypothetical protein